MSLVSVHVFHKRPICIEIFHVSSVQGTPEVMLSCSLRSSGSIYSRDEGECGASSRFLAAYGDQAWVQELAGGGGVCSQAKLGATRSSRRRLCLGEIFIAQFVLRCDYLPVCLLVYLFINT